MKLIWILFLFVNGREEEVDGNEETDCNGCNQDYTKIHINATNGDWKGCHKMCTCRQDLLSLQCDHAGLRYVPNKIPEDVQSLSFQGNDFVVIEQNIFSNAKSALILELSRSRIETVSKSSFRGLVELEQLDLNLNAFTGIGEEKVEEFNENYDMENTIPFDTFSEMTKLTKLALGFNKISFLGKGAFFGLDSLHTLNLEYNRLTDLLGHPFHHVPGVRDLNLAGNRLEVISHDCFENNRDLETLNLDKNQIRWLPADVFQHNMQISVLIMNRNAVAKIRNIHVGHLTQLRTLELAENQIESLNIEDLGETTQLQKLLLKANKITTIEDEALSRLFRLSFLDLSSNRLKQLGDYTFGGLENLRYLFLDKNQIETVDRYTFHQMKKLVSLTLGGNNIVHLGGDQFSPLRTIQFLNIADNQLASPAKGWFEPAGMKAMFDVGGNEWMCDCTILPFYNYVISTPSMSRKMSEMLCHGPVYLKERKLVDLKPSDLTCETKSHLYKTIEYHITDLILIASALLIGRCFFARSRDDFDLFHAHASRILRRQEKQL